MRGNKVERRFGWDCHGLPADGKRKATTSFWASGYHGIGIEKFNAYCQESVLKYTDEWEKVVTRQARWVDFENGYKTMDLDYMESVVAFKQLWDQGLVYESQRVIPYSWGAETPLSNFEIRLDDATRPRQDPAVTVAFDLFRENRLRPQQKSLHGLQHLGRFRVNLALAVAPDKEYALIDTPGQYI